MRALGKGSVASLVQLGLSAIWWLLWAGAVVLLLLAVAYGVVLVLIAQGVLEPAILTGGRAEIELGEHRGAFNVDFDTPGGITWPVAVPGFLAAAVAIGGGLVIVGRLRALFASFTSGEPFRKENAVHLRVIWMAMLAVELSRYAILALTGALVAAFHPPAAAGASFNLSIDLSTWAAILILIVLAEVFREGARMREEQELTI